MSVEIKKRRISPSGRVHVFTGDRVRAGALEGEVVRLEPWDKPEAFTEAVVRFHGGRYETFALNVLVLVKKGDE